MSRDTKTRPNIIKIRPHRIQILSLSLWITSHSPAPTVNGEKIDFQNGRLSNFEGHVTRSWIRSHGIPSCSTHRAHESDNPQKNFLWMDGRQTSFIRSTQSRSRPKNSILFIPIPPTTFFRSSPVNLLHNISARQQAHRTLSKWKAHWPFSVAGR